jgi:hypothetical protein
VTVVPALSNENRVAHDVVVERKSIASMNQRGIEMEQKSFIDSNPHRYRGEDIRPS